ncbi:hypothetical protein A2U01_0084843, partial [Trifolium medium]|nr:hypothetical protein [Trifolium medium]
TEEEQVEEEGEARKEFIIGYVSTSGSVPVRKKTMKQCDSQLNLIRMVL